MAVLINLGTGAGSTNGDTLYEAFVKINTNYSDLESTSNKSINVTTDGASDTKYPSVKAVKTYVDANAGGTQVIKVVKTTITSAQILDLFTTPITILDSSETGKVKLPLNAWIKRKVGTAYNLSSGSFTVINDTGSSISGVLSVSLALGNSTFGYTTTTFSLSQSGTGVEKNLLYKLKASIGNPTDGTGDIDVYVTYIEITL